MRSGVCSERPPLVPLIAASGSGSWATPCSATDSRKATASQDALDRGFAGTLTDHMRMWPTPLTVTAERGPKAKARRADDPNGHSSAPTLLERVRLWSTPTARDVKGCDQPGRMGGESLAQQTIGLRYETTPKDGGTGLPTADLNPFFVATLMGLPADWLTHSTSAVTASCHKQLRKPSDNYSSASSA